VLRVKTGHVVVSTDLMVEGRHFRRDWSAAEDVGHRAAAQNLSDINAMGGRATSLTIGLAAPADLPAEWALDFARGFAEECSLVGASVVGGDLSRADQVVIAVTVLGACTVAPVVRSGARPGDVLALCGRQGWAAGGMAVLGRGFRSPRVLVEAYRRPEPPYDAGQVAADAGATSMIDVSDGLLADAGHIAAASGVALDVRRDAFELAEPLKAVGAALGADPIQFVLGGGDDHALLATFPEGTVPDGWLVIGSVAEGAGVTVDGEEYDGPVSGQTGSAGDFSGLDATGADVEALGRAVDRGPHTLDVGVEATLRDLARPGAVVAEARLLRADVTDGSHRELLRIEVGTRARRSGQPHKGIRRPGRRANRRRGSHRLT
jgi:thiamine-monophosphate kinase